MFRAIAAMLALVATPAAAAPSPRVGEPAPDAKLKLVDGSTVALSALRGQVVVLNFWATWCVPCRRELPLLDAYYRLQKPHGLAVFAVTTEDSLPLYLLRSLFKVMAVQPVRAVKGPYGTIGSAVPTNYVIDRAGRIRYMKAGAFDADDLNRELVPLLNEPGPVSGAVPGIPPAG